MRILSTIILTVIFTAAAFSQQQLRPGVQAPTFTAQDIDGKQIDLNQLQGKVIVLTFWSTRCQICHSEIPKLNDIVDRYKGKDVVFLALTMENNVKIEPYLRKNPFHYDIVPNSFGVVLKYADMDKSGNINMGFPAHYLINRKGQIVHRTDGWDKAANLEMQISRLLESD